MIIPKDTLIELTADIVSAHVSRNDVPVDQVAGVIEGVFTALQSLGAVVEPVQERPTGAVPARSSVKSSHILSMIDGKPYKMLKRHLALNGYTPESYRKTFDLPRDYPMVAPEYTVTRRNLAKKIGLGRRPRSGGEAAES